MVERAQLHRGLRLQAQAARYFCEDFNLVEAEETKEVGTREDTPSVPFLAQPGTREEQGGVRMGEASSNGEGPGPNFPPR